VRGLTRRSLREQITVVLQDAQLFRQSVAENIGFGRKGAGADEIVEAAKEAGADEFISRMPHGYETVLAEGGDDLSGGERQRIHIARAMLRRTPIVILDEPVAGLDAVAEAKIQAAVRRLTQNRTTFIVAHKMSTLAHADRILVLENGSIAEQGTHEELLRESRAYREFCELQIGRPLPKASSNGSGVREPKTQTTGMAGGSK
jgi:ABC-type multidrug transport system fused ATPase/permease subunit